MINFHKPTKVIGMGIIATVLLIVRQETIALTLSINCACLKKLSIIKRKCYGKELNVYLLNNGKSYIKRMRLTWKIFSAYSIKVVMIVKFKLKD